MNENVKELLEVIEEAACFSTREIKAALMLYDLGVKSMNLGTKEVEASIAAIDKFYSCGNVSNFIDRDVLDFYNKEYKRLTEANLRLLSDLID